ncbi:MAG: hypothetical protein GWN02_28005, partial [Gemmatimonadetes bacterium]|nr:hypothetical protein [Gemmatimonadota bacterium]
LYRLSGEPGSDPGARIRHHGARVALVAGLSLMVAILFPPAETTDVTPYAVGMVSPEDVIAEIPFSV